MGLRDAHLAAADAISLGGSSQVAVDQPARVAQHLGALGQRRDFVAVLAVGLAPKEQQRARLGWVCIPSLAKAHLSRC